METLFGSLSPVMQYGFAQLRGTLRDGTDLIFVSVPQVSDRPCPVVGRHRDQGVAVVRWAVRPREGTSPSVEYSKGRRSPPLALKGGGRCKICKLFDRQCQ